MDLVQLLAPAIAAFLAGCLICWLLWRWRQHSVPVEEWSNLERRRRLLEGENLRLQDRVQLLEQQSQEFPSLREAISTRDDQILALEHDIGVSQAREIGITTRLEQLSNDLGDARRRERHLEDEVLGLRRDLTNASALTPAIGEASAEGASRAEDTARIQELEGQLAESEELVAKAERIAREAQRQAEVAQKQAAKSPPASTGAARPVSLLPIDEPVARPSADLNSNADANATANGVGAGSDDHEAVIDLDDLARLEQELSEAQSRNDELAAAKTTLEAEVVDAQTRIDNLVIDLRDRAASDAELSRLTTLATAREAEVDTLKRHLAKVSTRADASAVLAAELRSRLDNQLMQTSQLEQKLRASGRQ